MGTARSREQILQHYLIEKKLAERLKAASRETRASLYTEVYDELFARVPDHPQTIKRTSAAERAAKIESELGFLRKYMDAETNFLEIGAGDCALSLAAAGSVRTVQAVDVSNTITGGLHPPANFHLYISNGTDLGVSDSSLSLAYSNQLIEHLHPDDALEQVRNVSRALCRGGVYVCITPNRLTGPHDISNGFDAVATGLHLKEYSSGDLKQLLLKNGFARVEWYARLKGRFFRIPLFFVAMIETLLASLPRSAASRLGGRFPIRNLLEGIAVAVK